MLSAEDERLLEHLKQIESWVGIRFLNWKETLVGLLYLLRLGGTDIGGIIMYC